MHLKYMPLHAAYRAQNPSGFAYPTATKRWPVIVTTIIDDIVRMPPTLRTHARTAASSAVIARLAELKYEIQHGKKLRPIVAALGNENDNDADDWNAALATEFKDQTWMNAPWLVAECYLYRRVMECFWTEEAFGKTVKEDGRTIEPYDPFMMGKLDAFRSELDGVVRLCEAFFAKTRTEADGRIWKDLILLSLWGNGSDMSMFAGLDEKDINEMKSGSGEENVVSNDIPAAISFFEQKLGPDSRVDFILDNSGFELFSDLFFADKLVELGKAKTVVFHCKPYPWFVSDTTPRDVDWLLSSLSSPSEFFGPGAAIKSGTLTLLPAVADRWRHYLLQGVWKFQTDPFWCSPWPHAHLPAFSASLWKDLTEASSLVIFKGDLNYRKIMYDCSWPVDTPFNHALGIWSRERFGVLALRTCKSDVCVGVDQTIEEKLKERFGGDQWRWSGVVGVAQFSAGNQT